MTAETTPAPLTEADDALSYYGVHFWPIGEDGDPLMALGHVEPRRMVAAANRHYRIDVGERQGIGYWNRSGSWLAAVEHKHAVRLLRCLDADLEGHGEGTCYTCRDIADGVWQVRWNADASEPGAFPVTLLHV